MHGGEQSGAPKSESKKRPAKSARGKGGNREERGSSRREESHEAGQITIIPLEKPSLELRVEDETPSGSEVVSEIQSVLETISWMPERWVQLTGKLQERLRQIEPRELDLLHIIEFCLPAEEKMIGLYRALHELRAERRRMKGRGEHPGDPKKAVPIAPTATRLQQSPRLTRGKVRHYVKHFAAYWGKRAKGREKGGSHFTTKVLTVEMLKSLSDSC